MEIFGNMKLPEIFSREIFKKTKPFKVVITSRFELNFDWIFAKSKGILKQYLKEI